MQLALYGDTYLLLIVRGLDARVEYNELAAQSHGTVSKIQLSVIRTATFPQFFLWKNEQWKHMHQPMIRVEDIHVPQELSSLNLPLCWKYLDIGKVVLSHTDYDHPNDVRTPYGEQVVRIEGGAHLGGKSIYRCHVLQHSDDSYHWGRERYIWYREIVEKNLVFTDGQLQKVVEANLLL